MKRIGTWDRRLTIYETDEGFVYLDPGELYAPERVQEIKCSAFGHDFAETIVTNKPIRTDVEECRCGQLNPHFIPQAELPF